MKKGKNLLSKKSSKIILIIILIALIVIGGYFAYLVIDYHRIDDNQVLEVRDNINNTAEIGTEYKLVAYNVGFGAYTQNFSFFTEGGISGKAESAESVNAVMKGITDLLEKEDADIITIEEVDIDADRSMHINEEEIITNSLNDYDNVMAINFNSSYFLYPFSDPTGKSLSGIMTLSKLNIESSTRKSLPVPSGISKFLDLDRCYSVTRIPTSDGNQLVIYTLHLSAYSEGGLITTKQLEMLVNDMQSEYEKGHYCIASGDFNKDLLANGTTDSAIIFNVTDGNYSWSKPIDNNIFKGTNIKKVVPFNKNRPVPSCRSSDAPYSSKQYVTTVDGFLVSDNVKIVGADVYNTNFKYSDHNPVYLKFILN